MTHARVFYLSATGVAAAFMAMSASPDVLRDAQAVSIFEHLGYPAYILPFLGTPSFWAWAPWCCRAFPA